MMRTEEIFIRLTEAELLQLRRMAARSGVTLDEYIRVKALFVTDLEVPQKI